MSKVLRKTGKIIGVGTFVWIWALGAAISYATDMSLTLQGLSGIGKLMDMLDIMFLFPFLAVVPSFIIMMTSFTRIVIMLSFLRNVLGTQQSPPNQILVGFALFLILLIMSLVVASVNTRAYQPYRKGQITREQASERTQEPVKEFMLKQTEKRSLDLFLSISEVQPLDIFQGQEGYMKLGLTTIVPSFILNEPSKVFTMGFLIFVPFLIIDLVVSGTLVSMGMAMLPLTMIALPLKIMMFVLMNGWGLVIKALVRSFR